jgi:NTE family protein
MARPIDFAARHGAGLDRTVVLGGGGIYFVAWQVGYLVGLRDGGIDLRLAERVVGTSAGSIVGAVLTGGRLPLANVAAELLSRAKGAVAAIAPASDFAPSQLRALEAFLTATDARPATLQRIGHAALAAAGPEPGQLRRTLGLLVGRKWPDARLHVTGADAFTGERVVVTAAAGMSPARALAASSAVPGVFPPQRLGDRFCMDGGVAGSSTHCDLVAGAQRALVLALEPEEPRAAASMTYGTDAVVREQQALRASGTRVFYRSPVVEDLAMLMSPDAVEPGLTAGRARAAQDLPGFTEFWV